MTRGSASVGAFLNITGCEPAIWQEQLESLQATGVTHIELWLEYVPAPRELRVLASMLRGQRTIMHGPFIGLSLASGWDELAAISLDRCHRAVEVAGVLGCELVTLHAGVHGAFEDHTWAIERLAERVTRFSRITRPVITLENMPLRGGASSETVASAADLHALCVLLPDLHFTLDVGHCLQNGEDPAAVYEHFHDRIRNIHLHDARRGGSAHAELGSGELDLSSLLAALDDRGYDGFLTIETLAQPALEHSLSVLRGAGVGARAAA